MEEVMKGSPKKPGWNGFVLVGIILVALLSVVNFYQIETLKSQFAETKTKFEKWVPTFERWGKVIPSVAPTIFPEPTNGKQEPIEVIGTVQRSDIEDGCWYIDPNWSCQGDKCPLGLMASYEPINLPKELQKTGLKAKFKLEILPDVATICQIGPVVKILDYQIVK